MRTQNHPDDIDIGSMWIALKKSAPKILIGSCIASALAFVGLSLVAPRYTSQAQLIIEGKGLSDPFADAKGSPGNPEAVTVQVDREAIASQVISLKSEDLARKVAAELKLAQRPEFNSAIGAYDMLGGMLRTLGLAGPRPGETDEDRVLAAYSRGLQVFQGKDTRVITIEFSSIDSQLAAETANTLAKTFQASLRDRSVVSSNDTVERLKPQIEALKADVQAAETEVERTRAMSTGLQTAGKDSMTLNQAQLAEISTELTKAKGARSEAEARARSARDMMRTGSAEMSPDVQRSPSIQALAQQRARVERTMAELSASLLPGHPRMQQLTAELVGLKRQLATEVGRMVDSLEREAKVAALREETVKKRLDETSQRTAATGGDEVRLKVLESAALAKKKELEALQRVYQSAVTVVKTEVVPVPRIVQQARPSSLPSYPRKMPYSMLVFAASMLFGFITVITREAMPARRAAARRPAATAADRGRTDGKLASVSAGSAIRVSSDLAAAAPVAAARPAEAFATAEPETAPASTAGTVSTDSDSYATLATIAQVARHIGQRAPAQGGYRSLVVGETDAMRCGEEAARLVRQLAEDGRKTLLIDWSPSGRGFSVELGLVQAPGLSELLDGAASFEDVIQRMPGSEAHAISCGKGVVDPDAEPDADRLNLVLDALDEAYDHIVVAGSKAAARALFQAIQGRFDAGILVAGGAIRGHSTDAAPGTFLGFEIADIAVIRYERQGGSTTATRKMQLARSEARV